MQISTFAIYTFEFWYIYINNSDEGMCAPGSTNRKYLLY